MQPAAVIPAATALVSRSAPSKGTFGLRGPWMVTRKSSPTNWKQLSKTIVRDGRVDLLSLDELRYMVLDRRGVELLFQVLTEGGDQRGGHHQHRELQRLD